MRSTPVLTAVRRALGAAGAPCAGERVVLGFSGGADSLALLHALTLLARRQRLELVAAHLDHGLRPTSRADARFCREQAGRLGVAFETDRAEPGRRGGLEMAARTARLAFLREVASRHGAATIALAHTRDDQAETLLLRLLRGAAAAGLGAMRARRDDLWRPLLSVSREQVLAHLDAHGLSWCEDESNQDLSFARNRVRHELIPYLEHHFNPALRQVLSRSADVLAEQSAWLEREAGALLERARRTGRDGLTLDGDRLRAADPALARGALRLALSEAGGLASVSSRHLDTLLGGLRRRASSARRIQLPGGRSAVFRFGDLCLIAERPAAVPFDLLLRVPGRVRLPDGSSVVARRARGPARSGEREAVLPLPAAPLAVRSRRPGDRVRARGRVISLKRFLIERRVPADERTCLPLVACGPRVVWVPGQTIDTDVDTPAAGYVRLALSRVS